MAADLSDRVPPHYLGVDGDRNGAACLLDEHGAAWLLCEWRAVSRGYEAVCGQAERCGSPRLARCVASGAAELGKWIAAVIEAEFYAVAAEDVFVRPGGARQNIGSAIRLARWGGALVGPLELGAVGPARWVMATEWRARVLGLQRHTPREQAKRASLALLPARVPGLEELLAAVGRTHGATDAAGIACWLRSEIQEESRQMQIKQARAPGRQRAGYDGPTSGR